MFHSRPSRNLPNLPIANHLNDRKPVLSLVQVSALGQVPVPADASKPWCCQLVRSKVLLFALHDHTIGRLTVSTLDFWAYSIF